MKPLELIKPAIFSSFLSAKKSVFTSMPLHHGAAYLGKQGRFISLKKMFVHSAFPPDKSYGFLMSHGEHQ
jgi:hypothetical protein